ncbi:hypothetical protein KB219_35305, partial [Pseudomonas aeruginosa]|nr:hypothetical protein [Pseudomonas aeruginosa]
DLYIRLVGEAVEAYRAIADGEQVEVEEELGEIRIELPVDAFIPPEYVDGDRLRLEAYRKLSQAREPADIDAVVEELLDRYGPLPVEARRVVSVARLRLVAQKYRVREIVLAGFYSERLSFAFPPAFMREARLRVAAEWQPSDLVAIKRLIESGRLSFDGLITHHHDALDASNAYRTAFEDPACLKMVLNWSSLS